MSKLTLECSAEQFLDLLETLYHTRQSSRTVTVSADALAALLRDYGKLIGLHRHELDGAL